MRGDFLKRNIFLNYLYNMSYQILIMILPLVTTPYISRVLGAANIGAYSYTQSITYYFTLFGSMGLNLYGQREIAYAQDDREKRSKIFWELMLIRLITHGISLIVFFTTFIYHEKYGVLFAIQMVDIIASCLDISWLFQGLEDFKRLTIRNILVRLSAVVCIFLFVKSPGDLYIYAICYSASLLIGNMLMLGCLSKLIGMVKLQRLEINRHIRPCMMLFIPQIATSIYNVLDKTMIGAITKIEEEVAYYEQAQKIVKVAMSFLTSIGTVMLPRIAHVFAKKEHDEIQRYMAESFRYAFFLGIPLVLGMMAVAPGMVGWFYGQGYDRVVPNILTIAPIILIVGLSNVIGVQYLLPTGRQKDYLLSVLCGSAINITLNLIFITQFYSIGAALASVLAEVTVLLTQIILTRKEFKYGEIIKKAYKYLVAGATMYLTLYIFMSNHSSSVWFTAKQVLFGGIVYIGSLFVMRDEMIVTIYRKIRRNKDV